VARRSRGLSAGLASGRLVDGPDASPRRSLIPDQRGLGVKQAEDGGKALFRMRNIRYDRILRALAECGE
jgi:hypothetical protein